MPDCSAAQASPGGENHLDGTTPFEKEFDMYDKPSAPAGIGGVLDDGFKLFRACFTQVVGLAILASLISQIPSLVMTSAIDADGVPQLGAGVGIAALVGMLLSVVLFGALVSRIHLIHEGRSPSLGDSLNAGLACMLSLLGSMILYGLAVAVGMVLLIVPGLIVMVSLMFAPYIVVTEGAGVIESLRRSHQLVWGHWWRTSALVGIAGFILMVAYVLIALVAGVLMFANPDALEPGGFSVTQTVLTAVLGGLLTPLFYTLFMAAYYDLKLRREGDDLADRIDAQPASA
jgi:hypothetical protein